MFFKYKLPLTKLRILMLMMMQSLLTESSNEISVFCVSFYTETSQIFFVFCTFFYGSQQVSKTKTCLKVHLTVCVMLQSIRINIKKTFLLSYTKNRMDPRKEGQKNSSSQGIFHFPIIYHKYATQISTKPFIDVSCRP